MPDFRRYIFRLILIADNVKCLSDYLLNLGYVVNKKADHSACDNVAHIGNWVRVLLPLDLLEEAWEGLYANWYRVDLDVGVFERCLQCEFDFVTQLLVGVL